MYFLSSTKNTFNLEKNQEYTEFIRVTGLVWGMEATQDQSIFSAEEKRMIEQQLERLLSSSFFSHSRRFPAFLRYVVERTLEGESEQLKERTLGIEIFGKGAEYDTATDPIVRVTAAEIRKRIALYYQEPGHEQEMRISLPLGSYIPHFHPPDAELPTIDIPASTLAESVLVVEPTTPPHKSRWKPATAVFLFLVAVASFFWWKHERQSPFDQFWNPILGSSEPVLFCVADQTGYNAIALRDAADPSRIVMLNDSLTAVVIDDLSTITKIAGVLEIQHKPYSLRGEGGTTLMDLRAGPSVIIGAFDNAWTLRLLQPLRFHFANDREMSQFSIVDSTQPAKTRWTVDRNLQLATNNYKDYGIVARFTDDTTGKPTLIAAGIGRGGTIAAGEFVTSPTLLRAAEEQRPRNKGENMEVVLSTQIINGEPGTPTIETVYFW